MDYTTIGNPDIFAITYKFCDDTKETELSMYVEGKNLLEFVRNNQKYTTKWNLNDLAFWLRDYIDNMSNDPYPIDVPGDYAAIKDINAREFDTADDEAFDAYYDKIDNWNQRHRWHPASAGAILADIYFDTINDIVQISWNNQDLEPEVEFTNLLGYVDINKTTFYNVVNEFLQVYAKHWF